MKHKNATGLSVFGCVRKMDTGTLITTLDKEINTTKI